MCELVLVFGVVVEFHVEMVKFFGVSNFFMWSVLFWLGFSLVVGGAVVLMVFVLVPRSSINYVW